MTLPSTEELRRLLDEATPGEWYLHEDESLGNGRKHEPDQTPH